MRLLVRLLLLIPLGLLMAFSAGGFFLMLATVTSSALAQMVFGAASAFADVVTGLAFDGEDPTALALAASWQGFKLASAILIVPVLVTALASELFRIRSGMAQTALCGLLAAALPAAIIGLNRMPTRAETEILAAFFLTGTVTGAVYWLIAGRGAGGSAPRPPDRLNGPLESTGS